MDKILLLSPTPTTTNSFNSHWELIPPISGALGVKIAKLLIGGAPTIEIVFIIQS